MVSLWRGELSLAETFWFHAILGVGFVNLACTFARLLVIAEDWPWALAWCFLLLPVPYGIVAVVGVWRSSRRRGPGPIGALARWIAAAWGAVALVL